jgi:Spy/CpxP family protein refolding chaperone
MNKLKWVLVSVFAMGLWSSTPLGAGASDDGVKEPKAKSKSAAKRGGHPTRREILKQLGLTADQKKQLRLQRAELRKRLAVIDGEIKVQKVELQNELEKPERDPKKLEAITQKISDLKGRKMNEKIKANTEAEKILTPEQVEKWKSLERGDEPESEEGTDTQE